MKPICVVLFLFLGFVYSQKPGEFPKELECFIKGFFKCGPKIKNYCAEFKGDDRRPVPIPKDRLNGQCPILGQIMPLKDIKYIDLPPCPCKDGNPVSKYNYTVG